MKNKEQLRKEIKALLRKSSDKDLIIKSRLICNQLTSILITDVHHSYTIFGLFDALASEPKLDLLNSALLRANKRICFPYLNQKKTSNAENKIMEFKECMPDELSLNSKVFGVSLKVPKEQMKTVVPDALLIPGLAFDQIGNRLGKGLGFFDRYLETFSGLKIGVCFEQQMINKVPVEPHDQQVDYVVTEHKIYKIELRSYK